MVLLAVSDDSEWQRFNSTSSMAVQPGSMVVDRLCEASSGNKAKPSMVSASVHLNAKSKNYLFHWLSGTSLLS
jgi:hypothetical protein